MAQVGSDCRLTKSATWCGIASARSASSVRASTVIPEAVSRCPPWRSHPSAGQGRACGDWRRLKREKSRHACVDQDAAKDRRLFAAVAFAARVPGPAWRESGVCAGAARQAAAAIARIVNEFSSQPSILPRYDGGVRPPTPAPAGSQVPTTPGRPFAALTAYGLSAATPPQRRRSPPGCRRRSLYCLVGWPAWFGCCMAIRCATCQRHCRAGLSLGPAGGGLRSFRVRLPWLALEYAAGPGGAAAVVAHRAGHLYRPVRQ
jgi:hypothetical protein